MSVTQFAKNIRRSIGNVIQSVFKSDDPPPVDLEETFKYTVLEYRPSINDAEGIPLIVLVEAPMTGGNAVVYIGLGRSPTEDELESASELGKRILKQLGSWFESEVSRAITQSSTPLEKLARESPWNLTFRPPKERGSSQPLIDALYLFREEVIRKIPEDKREQLKEKLLEDIPTDTAFPSPHISESERVMPESDISFFRPTLSSEDVQPA